MSQLKIILQDKPKEGDLSQYNFDVNSINFDYENSTSLPENNDKFQNKDLFTNAVGNKINEDIIERNLKFEGDPSIIIENLYISNAGVGGTVKNNKVIVYMFSQAAYDGDPTLDGYGAIKSKLESNTDWIIYNEGFGNKSEGSDIGNIDALEGVEIVSNFSTDSANISLGDIPGRQLNIDEDETDVRIPSKIKAFKLSSITTEDDVDDLGTTLFDEANPNPIYVIVFTKGDKKVAWPIKTDRRRKKYSVFKISNDDLFTKVETDFIGTSYLVNFPSSTVTRTGEGGSGATKSAWKVSSLQIRINTLPGQLNNISDISTYQNSIKQMLPKTPINENSFNSVEWLGTLNPKNQLDNTEEVGDSAVSVRHPDFIPLTTFGYVNNNTIPINYEDLQTYHTDFNKITKASVPLNVGINFDIRDLTNTNIVTDNRRFYYLVLDWNDIDNRLQTIDDFLQSKPENQIEYLNLQNQNLYKVNQVGFSMVSNLYTTPGIKNIKILMFSVAVHNNEGGEEYGQFEVGRWKLITSRIYLDIPPNQYPDFNDVGGSDYTTIPWPYTTVVIGGVDNDSKYKTSVQNTLSSGNVGEDSLDILDEKFLVNDIENTELGQTIKSMDLEQCRYFNKYYGINDLLNINVNTNDGFRPYNYRDDEFIWDGETNKYSEETSVGQIFINDNLDLDLKQSCKFELNTGRLSGKTILDTSGNSNKGILIGDYKVKKNRKGTPMRRDSFIKVPKKTSNRRGAL